MKHRTLGWLSVVCVTTGGYALAADESQVGRGAALFEYSCASCHGGGPGFMGPGSLPGTMALALKYNRTKPPVLAERKDLDPRFVKTVVRHGIQAMPFFRKTEISDADLEAIAAYLARPQK